MNRLSRKTLGLLTLIIVAILIVIALLVKFDYKIKGPARIVAYSEWTISNLEQDKLIGKHVYNGIQNKHEMMLFHFQRPDFVRFALNRNLNIGDIIQAGQVVGQFSSSDDAIQLAALSGSLDQAKANLAALNAGEKTAFQREASEALTYAKAELAAYEPILERQKELHAKNLISDQELEIAQAQYELYKINVSVQEARLQSVKTGEKEETISIIEAQVKSLADQLSIYQQKLDAASIKSPVTGMLVQPNHALAEICHVCQLDSMIVQLPVSASEIKKVELGAPMTVNVSGSETFDLHVTGIDHNATLVMLKPMYIVTAVFANPGYEVKNGMTANVEISAGKSTLLHMLMESWTSFRFNK